MVEQKEGVKIMLQNKTSEDSVAYIEALKTIANTKQVKELCEPHVMSHEDIKSHHIVRLLYARKLLEDTREKTT